MHYLPTLLSAIGREVAVTTPCYWAPRLPVIGQCQSGDVAVYPDITPDNPLGAERVVRYMLYFWRGYFKANGGPDQIPDTDCVIVYHETYREEIQAHYNQSLRAQDVVCLPHVEMDWCFPGSKSIENLLYAGKQTVTQAPDGLEYTRIPDRSAYPDGMTSRMSTLQLLRAGRNLYTQDHFSVIEAEALLCGCKPFRVTADGGIEPSKVTESDAESCRMSPNRDIYTAEKFDNQVRKFFNL